MLRSDDQTNCVGRKVVEFSPCQRRDVERYVGLINAKGFRFSVSGQVELEATGDCDNQLMKLEMSVPSTPCSFTKFMEEVNPLHFHSEEFQRIADGQLTTCVNVRVQFDWVPEFTHCHTGKLASLPHKQACQIFRKIFRSSIMLWPTTLSDTGRRIRASTGSRNPCAFTGRKKLSPSSNHFNLDLFGYWRSVAATLQSLGLFQLFILMSP